MTPPDEGHGRPFRFAVVIPAYREVDRIGQTVTAIRKELADVDEGPTDPQLEVIVVDDGSSDGTADAALAAGADQVIVLPRNRGKGAAVRAGIQASRARAVAFTDADLAYHPSQLRRVLLEIESGADVVIGNRRHPESELVATSGFRSLGSRVVNRLASMVLLSAPHDTQCGLKGFSAPVARDIFAAVSIDRFGFDIEVLYLVERRGWSLVEIPVEMTDSGQRSTVRLVSGARLLRDLLRIRRRARHGAYD